MIYFIIIEYRKKEQAAKKSKLEHCRSKIWQKKGEEMGYNTNHAEKFAEKRRMEVEENKKSGLRPVRSDFPVRMW